MSVNLPNSMKLDCGLLFPGKASDPMGKRSALAESISAPVTAANVRRYFIGFIILRIDLSAFAEIAKSGPPADKIFTKSSIVPVSIWRMVV